LKFYKEGKIRAIGVSNFSSEQMDTFRAIAPLHSNQPPYNLFERAIDAEVLPYCEQNSIAVLTYSSLCRSMLGGRLAIDTEFPKGDIRSVDPKFQSPRFAQSRSWMPSLKNATANVCCISLYAGCSTGRV
jgi:aryl-alcohol dehydrogenase-like predicted oxidoreductase